MLYEKEKTRWRESDKKLPDISEFDDPEWEAVEITKTESTPKNNRYRHLVRFVRRSMDKPYRKLVVAMIRERYSVDEELAILRQRDAKPDEFAIYNEYAEECKKKAKGVCGLL